MADINPASVIVEIDDAANTFRTLPLTAMQAGVAALFEYNFDNPDENRLVGSAFALTRHTFVTARHVVDELNQVDNVFLALPTVAGIHRKAITVQPMHVVGANYDLGHDLAIVGVPTEGMRNQTWQQLNRKASRRIAPLALTFRFPNVGDEVIAIGYRRFRLTQDRSRRTLLGDWDFGIARGRVTEAYTEMQDRVMAPFPCFRVDAEFPGGMSGGPVMFVGPGTSSRRYRVSPVLGVVTSGMDGSEEGYTALASCVAPLQGLRMPGPDGSMSDDTVAAAIASKTVGLDARSHEFKDTHGPPGSLPYFMWRSRDPRP